jgi:hypothetical protein
MDSTGSDSFKHYSVPWGFVSGEAVLSALADIPDCCLTSSASKVTVRGLDGRGLILVRRNCVPLVLLFDALNYFEFSSLLIHILI